MRGTASKRPAHTERIRPLLAPDRSATHPLALRLLGVSAVVVAEQLAPERSAAAACFMSASLGVGAMAIAGDSLSPLDERSARGCHIRIHITSLDPAPLRADDANAVAGELQRFAAGSASQKTEWRAARRVPTSTGFCAAQELLIQADPAATGSVP